MSDSYLNNVWQSIDSDSYRSHAAQSVSVSLSRLYSMEIEIEVGCFERYQRNDTMGTAEMLCYDADGEQCHCRRQCHGWSHWPSERTIEDVIHTTQRPLPDGDEITVVQYVLEPIRSCHQRSKQCRYCETRAGTGQRAGSRSWSRPVRHSLYKSNIGAIFRCNSSHSTPGLYVTTS